MGHVTIRVVEVEQAGKRHQAAYFVEDGVIHATIGGRTQRFPVNNSVAPELIVQSQLAWHVVHQVRKAANLAAFTPQNRRGDATPA